MKVHTGSTNDTETDRVVRLLRRVGLTTGMLFGFGLVALVTAGNASADESRPDQPAVEQSVTEPVGGMLSDTLDGVAPVLEPVASVTRAAEPVLAPAVETVTPVLETVSPATEPLVEPLLDVVEPVVEPVTGAIGVEDEVSEVADAVSNTRDDRQNTEPAPVVPSGQSIVPAPAAEITAEPRIVTPVVPSAPVLVGSGHRDQPTVPVGPVHAVPGGTGSVGTTAGPHGADSVASAMAGTPMDDNRCGRGPPGTRASLPWLGFDRPDHPS